MGSVVQKAKLPVKQLTILAICRFAEPIALTSVYPYLPEMIESFGVRTDRVARWAGIASASFSVFQCFTAIIWGELSDRFGRKYLILTCLFVTMTASLLLGMSNGLPWMIIARCLGGVGTSTGVIRTMVAEMVPQKELQPRAFSVMPLVWNIGSVLGPSFGGALVNPARQYPKLFGRSQFFQQYPFILPNLVTAIIFCIGLVTGVLFLEETLQSRKDRTDYGLVLGRVLTSPCRKKRRSRSKSWQSIEGAEPLLSEEQSNSRPVPKPQPRRPRFSEVLSPQSNINLIVYTLLAMHSQAFDQMLSIFMHHPVQDPNSPDVQLPFKFASGFGISSERIGLLFTMYGVAGVLIQFLAFPYLAKKYGVLNCLRIVALGFPIAYIMTPFTALMPTPLGKQAVMFCIMLIKCWCGIFAFPCSTILLTNSATSLNILGTLNGIATSTSAIGRAMGPFLGGTTFTFGVDVGYVIFPWWLLAFIAIIAAIPVYFLEEMEGFSASDDTDDEEDEDNDDDQEADATGTATSPVTLRGGSKYNPTSADEDAIEEEDDTRLSEQTSRGRTGRKMSAIERRISTPIGMGDVGPPLSRRFSNSLGATRSGFGTGSGVGNQG